MKQLKGISEASIILSGKEKDLYLELTKTKSLVEQYKELKRYETIKNMVEDFLDNHFNIGGISPYGIDDNIDLFNQVAMFNLKLTSLLIEKLTGSRYDDGLDDMGKYARSEFLNGIFKDHENMIKKYFKEEFEFNKQYDLLNKNVEKEKLLLLQHYKDKISKFKRRVLKICKNRILSKIFRR